jgi:indolepyruvate ferredoxin oxidoreductase beta subunit
MTVVIGASKYPENIIEKLQENHKVYTIDGGAISKELGNSKVLNSVVLGLAAKYIGFSKEEWISIIEKTVPAKTIEINKLAFLKGYDA